MADDNIEPDQASFDKGYSEDANQVNQDDLILQQSKNIEKEISDSIMLVGDKEDIMVLEQQYIGDEVYKGKVKDLARKYSNLRRTRPDGNCFFRSFGFALLESLYHNKSNYESFRLIAEKSKDKLLELGFQKFTLEDFHDQFMEVVNLISKPETNEDTLVEVFNNKDYSDYVVVYLRLIASGQLQQDADFYQNFIEGNRTVFEFCRQEVEPMFKESDHIHIIALSTALDVGVRVRYMDRGDSTEAIAHDFPEDKPPQIHLLYRPGHYDILYPL
ncbi:hypothetical protein M8J76_008784 [Diaphorina citri]|nr:hypothetical protein M8J75_010460 [Diaphorina citri]KAI5745164.1 hypothetical protein M8J76_008784 [Diaphorina citri]KAI5752217.1 hypothetical protein M8J77_014962 [Diaphorina citri]